MRGWVNTTQYQSNERRVLHTDESCHYVTPESKPAADAPVDADELDVCGYCAGEVERIQKQQRDCPFCGERVDRLPTHLPCKASP